MTHLQLNEIGRATLVTANELLFDAYRRNKPTGAFILTDPITNNASCVGMIIGPAAERHDAHDAMPTLHLKELGIGREHYEAIAKAAEALRKQGIEVRVVAEE